MNKVRFSAFGAMLTGWLLSFRVLTALATSVSVTAAVSVPLGYQAVKAREVVVAAASTTTTTLPGEIEPGANATTQPTSTTTTSTTLPAPTTTTGIVIPGTPTVPVPTTSVPGITSEGLFASVSPDHSKPAILNDATVIRRIWVFFDGPGVISVSYWLDQPDGAGKPTATADGPPFDLAAAGFDFDDLEVGSHSILAEVTTASGRYERFAVFNVRH